METKKRITQETKEITNLDKPIIISLGGSIIVPDKIDTSFLKEFKKLILNQVNKGKKFIIICGGGKICREYIDASNEITETPAFENDRLGAIVTQLNAWLVRKIFHPYSHHEICLDYTKKTDFKNILLSAGIKPGTSTDFDAVMFAKLYQSYFVINMSNITYLYDKDPRKYEDAVPIEDINWDDFLKITGTDWKAGKNTPFDPLASKAAKENGISAIIINGKDLKNFEALLNNKKFKGTTIHS